MLVGEIRREREREQRREHEEEKERSGRLRPDGGVREQTLAWPCNLPLYVFKPFLFVSQLQTS